MRDTACCASGLLLGLSLICSLHDKQLNLDMWAGRKSHTLAVYIVITKSSEVVSSTPRKT